MSKVAFALLSSLPLFIGLSAANADPHKPIIAPKPSGPAPNAYGDEVVRVAIATLGYREDSTAVASWLAALGINTIQPWCAAAVTQWLRYAAIRLHRAPPVPGSALSKGLWHQFDKVGRALNAIETRNRTLPPGTVLVWDRSDPPFSTNQGHTGIVEKDLGANGWQTIEGNTISDDVKRVLRPRNDPRLYGAGLVG